MWGVFMERIDWLLFILVAAIVGGCFALLVAVWVLPVPIWGKLLASVGAIGPVYYVAVKLEIIEPFDWLQFRLPWGD